MIARIQYQGKVYHSYVFAYFEHDYMPQYLVYDMIDNKFDIIANFSKKCDGKRQVGLLNENEKDFTVKYKELELNIGLVRKFKSYSWLELSLINDIYASNEIDSKFKELAMKMNETIDPNGWNEVLNEEDANEFMEHVGCFHDMYLIGMNAVSDYLDFQNEAKLQLRFHSQGAFDVLVEFEGAIDVNYTWVTCNRIYLSSIVFKEPNIYWLDGSDELTAIDINDYSYISGQKLRWKFILSEEDEW